MPLSFVLLIARSMRLPSVSSILAVVVPEAVQYRLAGL
jgi:hypothetical protein